MKKIFYQVSNNLCKVECFKLSGRNELTEPAYEVICTNRATGDNSSIEAYEPSVAIALADAVMKGVETNDR